MNAFCRRLRGNRTAVVDALHNRTTFEYDLGNRLTKINYPDTTFVSFGYDSRGRRTSVTDQNQKTTTYAYDDADRLTSVIDAAHNQSLYDYDSENNLLSITDANLNKTSFSYDAFGRVTQTTFPAANSIETYVYDAIGNLTSKTDRKAQTINYIYDALNRLQHKGYPDATGVDYVYDLVGKIKQVTDPTGVYGFAYDNMGRLIGTTTSYSFLPGHTYTNSYGYDAILNRVASTGPDGNVTSYQYDYLNRLTTQTSSFFGQFTWGYDQLSRRTAYARPNGVVTSYEYDPMSRLASIAHTRASAVIDGASYRYDTSGSRISKTNLLTNMVEQYEYDSAYQLTSVLQGTAVTESYSYDGAGNRLTSLGGTTQNTYNTVNQLLTTASAAYSYDSNGNLTARSQIDGSTVFAWDFENRLASVTLPGTAGTVSYVYDPFGRRIQKRSLAGTTNYLYDGANVAAEADGAGTITASYTAAFTMDAPLAQLRGGAMSFYQQDGIGSVTSLTDQNGAISGWYVYNSFGAITQASNNVVNAFKFTGRPFDEEVGLGFHQARYYDPAVGRFISEDPIGFEGGLNLYAYTDNNPINFLDPFGLQKGGGAVMEPPVQVTPAPPPASPAPEPYFGPPSSTPAPWIARFCAANPAVCVAIVGTVGYLVMPNSDDPHHTRCYDEFNVPGCPPGSPGYIKPHIPLGGPRPRACIWPNTPEEMDKILGFEGTRIPDGAKYPGRGKVVWSLGPNFKIVYEAHPYAPAGQFIPGHSDPHWHLDTPGASHQRFCCGDKIPGMK